jgi:hypothetical protein
MERIFTNRILVESIDDKIGKSGKTLDYTFNVVESYKIGDEVTIEKCDPVINGEVVPPVIHIKFKSLNRTYVVYQPEDFFETEATYYEEHWDFIFESIEDAGEGEYQMAEWFCDDDTNLKLHAAHCFEGEKSNERQFIKVHLYESENREEDDRCIIILDIYDSDDEKHYINFLDGEEISDIDIEQEDTNI